MIHVVASCNPCFHTTRAHYINADTTSFMQLMQGNLLADLPELRLVVPHSGGAVPYHWGRYRRPADILGQPPVDRACHEERVLRYLCLPSSRYRRVRTIRGCSD